MPITTRCSHCGRLFPIYAQQIKERRGKIDCPQCGERFDGIAGLVDEAMDANEMGSRRPRIPPPDDNGAAAPAPMMTFDNGEPRAGGTRSSLWTLGVVLLLTALAAQVFWWERGTWLNYPLVRELELEICSRFDICQPVPRVAGSLEVLQPALSEKPSDDHILRLDLTLINRSQQLQRPPLLQVELFDDHGELLAARRFEPGEYLDDAAPTTALAAGSATNIALELGALGEQPTGFRVQLY